MMLWLLAIVIIGAASSPPSSPAASPAANAAVPPGDAIEIRSGTKVEFATAAMCARHLSSRDLFVKALGPFDRSGRLKVNRNVTEAEYLAFVSAQAKEWSPEEKARLRTILESFRAKTARFDLHFPPSISLLKTTGLEEGMAAYCRGASIVIPERIADGDPARLEPILVHELFHIYRSHHQENRRALYRIIGFDVCPEIALPEELRSRKITNPDAPLIDSFIRLHVAGKLVAATPVLFARTELYDPKVGGEFFESLVFKLMALDEGNGRFQPSMLPGGKPRLLDPSETDDYLSQIGGNTQYIIHPEEILADNFALMVLGAPKVATPRILEEMRAVLTK